MIIVNVSFADNLKSYDFKVDENAKVEKVIEEMVFMFAEAEHIGVPDNLEEFCLCNKNTGVILQRESSLAENEIISGKYLYLI